MTKYHPIGFTKIDNKRIINLSNREVELIRMIRKVEGDDYFPFIRNMWSHYLNEMEKYDIDTTFVKSSRYKE